MSETALARSSPCSCSTPRSSAPPSSRSRVPTRSATSPRSHQGLNARLSEAKAFYGGFAALLVVAGTVAIIPGAPLGVITLAVQALCGLMLPSTTIIVLMLANDAELMGPWKNGRWLNIVAVIIVAVLVVLSLTLMISTLFTSIDVLALLEILGFVAVIGLAVGLPMGLRRMAPTRVYDIDKRDWRTPRLALLAPMPTSKARRGTDALAERLSFRGRHIARRANHSTFNLVVSRHDVSAHPRLRARSSRRRSLLRWRRERALRRHWGIAWC